MGCQVSMTGPRLDKMDCFPCQRVFSNPMGVSKVIGMQTHRVLQFVRNLYYRVYHSCCVVIRCEPNAKMCVNSHRTFLPVHWAQLCHAALLSRQAAESMDRTLSMMVIVLYIGMPDYGVCQVDQNPHTGGHLQKWYGKRTLHGTSARLKFERSHYSNGDCFQL